ncbi:hypothetical protein, partial [Salmonella enterica]|uniref:hypothetical protein n=1 Tax=Salmonella enterica TaxID=28901 RepID=UPI00118F10D2
MNKTATVKPKLDTIPSVLKEHDHWLLWNSVPMENGKLGKQPVDLDGTIFKGWNDTDNLYSFETVADAYNKGNFDGIGFSQVNTPLV